MLLPWEWVVATTLRFPTSARNVLSHETWGPNWAPTDIWDWISDGILGRHLELGRRQEQAWGSHADMAPRSSNASAEQRNGDDASPLSLACSERDIQRTWVADDAQEASLCAVVAATSALPSD